MSHSPAAAAYVDAEDMDKVEVNLGPINNTQAWQMGKNYGSSCSQKGGYCYLCYEARRRAEEEHADDDGYGEGEDRAHSIGICDDAPEKTRDYVAIIEDIVDTLVAERKERPYIVMHVSETYNRKIRKRTRYRDFHTGQVVKAPEWTREMIDRHLTYSGKWPDIFDNSVELTIQTVLSNQADFLLDVDTGMVVPQRVTEYIRTGDFYMRWKMHREKLRGMKRSTARKGSGMVSSAKPLAAPRYGPGPVGVGRSRAGGE